MKAKSQLMLGIAAVFVLAFGAGLNNHVAAKGQNIVAENQSKGIAISPSVDKIDSLKPGEIYERKITIKNKSNEEKSFKVLASSFWVEGEDYEVKWGVSDSQYGKIAGWTDIDSTIDHKVKAGELYTFKYKISVPKDQAGGAQHLMVTISMENTGGAGFVGTETHLNTLIYANVEGDTNPSAEIVSQTIQGFSLSPRLNTSSVLKNTGNVDLDVEYKVYANAFFSGNQVYMDAEIKTLMTDSTRMLRQDWTDAPLLGIFNMVQEITFLGETHSFSSVAIICPIWLIIITVIVIAVMILLIVRRAKARKRHKR